MESINYRISKGIFVYQNGLNGGKSKHRPGKFQIPKTYFDADTHIEPWDEEFQRMWGTINSKIEAFQSEANEESLAELIRFVENSYALDGSQQNAVAGATYLPVAALLTGINKPDHHQYFKTFSEKLTLRYNGHIAILPARDCPSLRSTIEVLVSSIISNGQKYNFEGDDDEDEEDDEVLNDVNQSLSQIKLKRNQYTLDVLQSWYSSLYPDNSDKPKAKISIIIPNFEEFNTSLIQDLILILSNRCKQIPIVLVLGVATSATTIFQTLSVNETTRIKLSVFTSQTSNESLNTIIEEILLSPVVPFLLSGKVLKLLKNIFLYYDFTTTVFLKGYKYCMLEHYSQGNAFSVCTSSLSRSMERIDGLTHEDLETIRRLPSFRKLPEFLETDNSVIRAYRIAKFFKNDDFLKDELKTMVANIHSYFLTFHCFVRVMFILVKDLPGRPLGKHLGALYEDCLTQGRSMVDTELFQKCADILKTMAKDELVSLIERSVEMMDGYLEKYCPEDDSQSEQWSDIKKRARDTIIDAQENLMEHAVGLSTVVEIVSISSVNEVSAKPESRDDWQQKQRQQLVELQKSKQKMQTVVIKLIDYLQNDLFGVHLTPFVNGPPMIELFVFSRSELVRSHITGAPRGAIHTALSNPYNYLDCKCCKLDNPSQLISTMPDISVAYKLLLESGQQVNLYDWLQAFWSVLESPDDDSEEVPQVIQAKFLRARAELELLGFIKTSKRKTDHVTKLVWEK